MQGQQIADAVLQHIGELGLPRIEHIIKQPVPQTAAADYVMGGAGIIEHGLQNQHTRHDNVGPASGHPVHFLALFRRHCGQKGQDLLQGSFFDLVLVGQRQGIFARSLVQLAQGPDGSAQPDQRQSLMALDPGLLFQSGQHHLADFGGGFRIRDSVLCKPFGGIDGAEGEGNAVDQRPFQKQRNLGAAAADVDNQAILYVHGVDHPQESEMGLHFT
ncbi:hypothetical protein D3C75_791220 [compost metagenome]